MYLPDEAVEKKRKRAQLCTCTVPGESWEQCHPVFVLVLAGIDILVHLYNEKLGALSLMDPCRTYRQILVIQDVAGVLFAHLCMGNQLRWKLSSTGREYHYGLALNQRLLWKEMNDSPLLTRTKGN